MPVTTYPMEGKTPSQYDIKTINSKGEEEYYVDVKSTKTIIEIHGVSDDNTIEFKSINCKSKF